MFARRGSHTSACHTFHHLCWFRASFGFPADDVFKWVQTKILFMSAGAVVYKETTPSTIERRLIDSIELEIGGRVNIPKLKPEERPDGPDDVTVLETDDPQDYLTVQKRSGDDENTYEFCFRVDGYTATWTTLTRMEDGKDCAFGWVPQEVKDAIHHHHPNMTIETQ